MDLALRYDPDLMRCDLVLQEDGSLLMDEGLDTAVLISLLSDRRAEEDDPLPTDDGNRRGFWGDSLLYPKSDRLGSRLWLLGREKKLPEVLRRAEDYASEALPWLTEDAHATKVEAKASSSPDNNILALAVTATLPGGRTQRTDITISGDAYYAV